MAFLKAENTGVMGMNLCPPRRTEALEMVCMATGPPSGDTSVLNTDLNFKLSFSSSSPIVVWPPESLYPLLTNHQNRRALISPFKFLSLRI